MFTNKTVTKKFVKTTLPSGYRLLTKRRFGLQNKVQMLQFGLTIR